MSTRERIDELLRLIDDVLGSVGELDRADGGAARPASPRGDPS